MKRKHAEEKGRTELGLKICTLEKRSKLTLFMKEKEQSEKAGLKLNLQKTKIIASGPISSQEIDWETMKIVTDFIFFSSKITAEGDCSHEIKRHLLLERKAMTNLDSILKSRDFTLPAKVHLSSQGYGFSSSHVMDVSVGL